jgi:hypothetical protein
MLSLTAHFGSVGIVLVAKLVPRNPMPKDLVLDLIAITRLLYAAEQARGGHPVKLQEIADIGRSLKIALDMAVTCSPGAMGQAVAFDRCDKAIEKLSDLLQEERALPLLQTIEARVLRLKRAL